MRGWAADQCLSSNVTGANQTSVPASTKQSQNNKMPDTAGGSNSPKIGGAADTMLPGNQK